MLPLATIAITVLAASSAAPAGSARASARGPVPAAGAAADRGAKMDVWMVPHAHCDVGWLMSVDGYFNQRRWDGSENSQSVSNILTEVTKALDADHATRFIWSDVPDVGTVILLMWTQRTPPRISATGCMGGWGWSNHTMMVRPNPPRSPPPPKGQRSNVCSHRG